MASDIFEHMDSNIFEHMASNIFEDSYGFPGLTNTLADSLSRKFMPGEADWALPKALESAEEVKLTTRGNTPRGSMG